MNLDGAIILDSGANAGWRVPRGWRQSVDASGFA